MIDDVPERTLVARASPWPHHAHGPRAPRTDGQVAAHIVRPIAAVVIHPLSRSISLHDQTNARWKSVGFIHGRDEVCAAVWRWGTASSDFQPLANDSVTDTIAALVGPDLVVTKQATGISDPINLSVNPLAIPGSIIEYTVSVENQGAGTVDADTMHIIDQIPSDGCVIVDDIAAVGSGPVDFADGSPSSGLTYTFSTLGDIFDDVAFSNDGGATYNYTPTSGVSGCDSAVTHIDINPRGQFAADTGSGSPEAAFSFRVVIN